MHASCSLSPSSLVCKLVCMSVLWIHWRQRGRSKLRDYQTTKPSLARSLVWNGSKLILAHLLTWHTTQSCRSLIYRFIPAKKRNRWKSSLPHKLGKELLSRVLSMFMVKSIEKTRIVLHCRFSLINMNSMAISTATAKAAFMWKFELAEFSPFLLFFPCWRDYPTSREQNSSGRDTFYWDTKKLENGVATFFALES